MSRANDTRGEHLVPIAGTPHGFELHGVRVTPRPPCLVCSARAIPGSELCSTHAPVGAPVVLPGGGLAGPAPRRA